MEAIYRRLIREALPRQQFKQIIERLADTNGPTMIVHCSGGKDRTGIVVALIQSLLGVAEADIIDDFMLSERYYDGSALMLERASQVLDTDDADFDTNALLPVFTVRRSYIEAALDEIISAHQSVERYLDDAVGVAPDAIDRLRAQLIS